MPATQEFFAIRKVDLTHSEEALRFHLSNRTPYLWPRNQSYFNKLAEDGHLFEAIRLSKDGATVIGLCYISVETDNVAGMGEFGGVYVLFRHRVYDLAYALGIVAIASFYLQDRPRCRLIAHVHQDNSDPLALLEKLGFVFVDKVTVPPSADAPETMPKDDDGNVIGIVFEFKRSKLHDFASWVKSFDGTARRKRKSPATLQIDVLGFQPEARGDIASALMEITNQV